MSRLGIFYSFWNTLLSLTHDGCNTPQFFLGTAAWGKQGHPLVTLWCGPVTGFWHGELVGIQTTRNFSVMGFFFLEKTPKTNRCEAALGTKKWKGDTESRESTQVKGPEEPTAPETNPPAGQTLGWCRLFWQLIYSENLAGPYLSCLNFQSTTVPEARRAHGGRLYFLPLGRNVSC